MLACEIIYEERNELCRQNYDGRSSATRNLGESVSARSINPSNNVTRRPVMQDLWHTYSNAALVGEQRLS
jgi:hypothetical protein